MSEGYERRPEERFKISDRAKTIAMLTFMASSLMLLGAMLSHIWSITTIADLQWRLDIAHGNYAGLNAEHDKLKKELLWWTCRVQYEPAPVPEQVGEGPTLRDESEGK